MSLRTITLYATPFFFVLFYFYQNLGDVNMFPFLSPSCFAAKSNPMCKFSNPLSDYCDLKGDIRIHGNSSTIFIISNDKTILARNSSWINIKPYARKGDEVGLKSVREWTIKLVGDRENVLRCTQTHDVPAIIFSLSSYANNLFHDFTDILIPLFSNTWKFKREVHFLNANYSPHWIFKFRAILEKLSSYPIVNINMEKEIRCYKKVIIGLERDSAFDLDPSMYPNNVTMKYFKQFIRSTYSLKRSKLTKLKKGINRKKPRLMIISREKSRKWRNLNETIKMAQNLGFDVVVAEANTTSEVSKFGRLVNSCDVLIGIHGAGLENLVFLPDEAVLIHVIPVGVLELYAKSTFEQPAKSMKVRYFGYKIQVNESSLIERYRADDPVFKDPWLLHKQGWWEQVQSTYLDNQDVTLDIDRFRHTLVKALHLLHH